METVEKSAQQGCDICALVFQHLVLVASQPDDQTGPITLSAWRDHLGFHWGTLQSRGLELCERECSLQLQEVTKNVVRSE